MVLPTRVLVLVYCIPYLTVATELLVSKSINCLQIRNPVLGLISPGQGYSAIHIRLRWLQRVKHA